jgi:hypothetical protein
MPDREIKKLQTKKKFLSDLIYKMFHKEELVTVTYDEMKLIRYFETIDLSGDGKVLSQRLPFSGTSLYFRVWFAEGGILSVHDHDCKETIWGEFGEVYEERSKTTVKKNTQIYFYAGTPHIFVARKESIIYVEFTKPM